MPPRFVYWTIIFGGQPTAFRAGTRDELLPTFKQIQSKHPDAELRYFARGKLWYSDEEARAALIRERFEKRERPRPTGPRPRPGEWKPPDQRPQHRREDWKPRSDNRPPKPEGWAPRSDTRSPKPGGWKPRSDARPPKPEGSTPRSDTRPPKPGGWKPRDESRKPGPGGERRDRDWRPGGAHTDPRSRFKVPRDVKRRGMARKFGWKKKKDDDQ